MEGVRPIRAVRAERLSRDLPRGEAEAGFPARNPGRLRRWKYVFDFASCRSTWVTHTDGEKPDLDLNIGAQSDGCFMAHIPADTVGHGGNTDYICTIPFQSWQTRVRLARPAR